LKEQKFESQFKKVSDLVDKKNEDKNKKKTDEKSDRRNKILLKK
jgi:hypothetical protein